MKMRQASDENRRREPSTVIRRPRYRSRFPIAISDTIKGFDCVEALVGGLEFFPEPLDVAVDRSVIDIDLIVIGGVHEAVAAFDETRPLRECLKNQELCDREPDGLAVPGAFVTLGVERELSSNQGLFLGLAVCRRTLYVLGAPQH